MRFVRLAAVLLTLLGMVGVAGAPARADVLDRLLSVVDEPSGGTAAPRQSADLTAWAGEARSTTLPELLQVAVRQAPSLASATIDIEIAEARIQQTWSRNDWLVQAKAQGVRDYLPEIVGSGVVVATEKRFTGTADVSRLLPTGGTIDLHFDTTYENIGADGFGYTQWSDNINASLTQPLLKGRGRQLFDANDAKARLAHDSATLAKRLAAINTIQAVISAYWDLVLAEQTVAITQQSLDLARERLRVTQIGADGGKVARSEIPAVLQIIATREEDVLTGELNVLNSSIALRRSAGLPIGQGELGLRVSTDLAVQDQQLELGSLVERAYAASPELAQLARQDASATIDVEVAENGLLPQLDLALTLGPNGTEDTTTSRHPFNQAWKDVITVADPAITGSLTFSRSVGQNDVRGRLREQRETKRKLVVNAFDLRAQLAQTMARAVAQIELARRRVTLSQRAIDLANENIKIETDRFNLGKSTNFDVLNRLEDLRQAELRKAQAMIDWHKAEIVVDSLTGDVLPKYGIAVP